VEQIHWNEEKRDENKSVKLTGVDAGDVGVEKGLDLA